MIGIEPNYFDSFTYFTISYFQNTEESLPVCSPNMVCNKVDTYGSPWVERQCRCPATSKGKPGTCSTSIHPKDGFTVVDRNRQYKVDITVYLDEGC